MKEKTQDNQRLSEVTEENLRLKQENMVLKQEAGKKDDKINQMKKEKRKVDLHNSRMKKQLNEEKEKWEREMSHLKEAVIKLRTELRIAEQKIKELKENDKLIRKGMTNIIIIK